MVISGIYKAAVLGSQAMDWDGITPPEQLPSTTAELLTSPLQSLHEQRELYAHHAERAQGALAQFERLAAAAQPAGAAAPELRALAAQLRALRALVERLEQQRPPAAGPPPKRRAEAAAGGGGGRKRGRKGAAAKPAEAPAAPPPAAAPAAEAPSDAAGSGAASRAQLVSTLPIFRWVTIFITSLKHRSDNLDATVQYLNHGKQVRTSERVERVGGGVQRDVLVRSGIIVEEGRKILERLGRDHLRAKVDQPAERLKYTGVNQNLLG